MLFDFKANDKNYIDLGKTFNCGQCFGFELMADGFYEGVSKGKVLRVKQSVNGIETESDDPYWIDFLDLETDYNLINKELFEDNIMKKAIEYGSGIRILKQDTFEALISFIISANNNIPRIKGILQRLRESFGEKFYYNNKEYYSFPKPESLINFCEDELLCLRAGFRAKYIIDAAKKVYNKEIDLEALKKMPLDTARKELQRINGVGLKVADCVLLFGCYRLDAFPIDVWVRRIMHYYYGNLDYSFFGKNAGIAQQYLFYMARCEKIK